MQDAAVAPLDVLPFYADRDLPGDVSYASDQAHPRLPPRGCELSPSGAELGNLIGIVPRFATWVATG